MKTALIISLCAILSLSTMGKKKDKKKWKDNFDKHLGENSNDKGMALKQLDVMFHTTAFKGQVHGSAHADFSKCCFSAGTCCIVYASNMIMS